MDVKCIDDLDFGSAYNDPATSTEHMAINMIGLSGLQYNEEALMRLIEKSLAESDYVSVGKIVTTFLAASNCTMLNNVANDLSARFLDTGLSANSRVNIGEFLPSLIDHLIYHLPSFEWEYDVRVVYDLFQKKYDNAYLLCTERRTRKEDTYYKQLVAVTDRLRKLETFPHNSFLVERLIEYVASSNNNDSRLHFHLALISMTANPGTVKCMLNSGMMEFLNQSVPSNSSIHSFLVSIASRALYFGGELREKALSIVSMSCIWEKVVRLFDGTQMETASAEFTLFNLRKIHNELAYFLVFSHDEKLLDSLINKLGQFANPTNAINGKYLKVASEMVYTLTYSFVLKIKPGKHMCLGKYDVTIHDFYTKIKSLVMCGVYLQNESVASDYDNALLLLSYLNPYDVCLTLKRKLFNAASAYDSSMLIVYRLMNRLAPHILLFDPEIVDVFFSYLHVDIANPTKCSYALNLLYVITNAVTLQQIDTISIMDGNYSANVEKFQSWFLNVHGIEITEPDGHESYAESCAYIKEMQSRPGDILMLRLNILGQTRDVLETIINSIETVRNSPQFSNLKNVLCSIYYKVCRLNNPDFNKYLFDAVINKLTTTAEKEVAKILVSILPHIISAHEPLWLQLMSKATQKSKLLSENSKSDKLELLTCALYKSGLQLPNTFILDNYQLIYNETMKLMGCKQVEIKRLCLKILSGISESVNNSYQSPKIRFESDFAALTNWVVTNNELMVRCPELLVGSDLSSSLSECLSRAVFPCELRPTTEASSRSRSVILNSLYTLCKMAPDSLRETTLELLCDLGRSIGQNLEALWDTESTTLVPVTDPIEMALFSARLYGEILNVFSNAFSLGICFDGQDHYVGSTLAAHSTNCQVCVLVMKIRGSIVSSALQVMKEAEECSVHADSEESYMKLVKEVSRMLKRTTLKGGRAMNEATPYKSLKMHTKYLRYLYMWVGNSTFNHNVNNTLFKYTTLDNLFEIREQFYIICRQNVLQVAYPAIPEVEHRMPEAIVSYIVTNIRQLSKEILSKMFENIMRCNDSLLRPESVRRILEILIDLQLTSNPTSATTVVFLKTLIPFVDVIGSWSNRDAVHDAIVLLIIKALVACNQIADAQYAMVQANIELVLESLVENRCFLHSNASIDELVHLASVNREHSAITSGTMALIIMSYTFASTNKGFDFVRSFLTSDSYLLRAESAYGVLVYLISNRKNKPDLDPLSLAELRNIVPNFRDIYLILNSQSRNNKIFIELIRISKTWPRLRKAKYNKSFSIHIMCLLDLLIRYAYQHHRVLIFEESDLKCYEIPDSVTDELSTNMLVLILSAIIRWLYSSEQMKSNEARPAIHDTAIPWIARILRSYRQKLNYGDNIWCDSLRFAILDDNLMIPYSKPHVSIPQEVVDLYFEDIDYTNSQNLQLAKKQVRLIVNFVQDIGLASPTINQIIVNELIHQYHVIIKAAPMLADPLAKLIASIIPVTSYRANPSDEMIGPIQQYYRFLVKTCADYHRIPFDTSLEEVWGSEKDWDCDLNDYAPTLKLSILNVFKYYSLRHYQFDTLSLVHVLLAHIRMFMDACSADHNMSIHKSAIASNILSIAQSGTIMADAFTQVLSIIRKSPHICSNPACQRLMLDFIVTYIINSPDVYHANREPLEDAIIVFILEELNDTNLLTDKITVIKTYSLTVASRAFIDKLISYNNWIIDTALIYSANFKYLVPAYLHDLVMRYIQYKEVVVSIRQKCLQHIFNVYCDNKYEIFTASELNTLASYKGSPIYLS